jgi:signal transduction histidine kinase
MPADANIILFAVFSVSIVILGLFLIFVMMMVRSHRKIEAAQQERIRQVQLFSDKLQNTREEEQKRIARELHDELGGTLTSLKYDLHWLEHTTASKGEIAQRYQAMNDLIGSTTKLVQRISSELRPKILDSLGLNAAVEWQAGEFKKRTNVGIQLHLTETLPPMDDALKTGAYRIIQESLTNIARHAQAASVEITIDVRNQNLFVLITDNGKGFDKSLLNHPESLGLLSIQERARMIGGKAVITGEPGKGTQVTLEVPLKNADVDTKGIEL